MKLEQYVQQAWHNATCCAQMEPEGFKECFMLNVAQAIASAVEEARAAGHAAGVAEERERAAKIADLLRAQYDRARWYAASKGYDSDNQRHRSAAEAAYSIARAIRNGEDAA